MAADAKRIEASLRRAVEVRVWLLGPVRMQPSVMGSIWTLRVWQRFGIRGRVVRGVVTAAEVARLRITPESGQKLNPLGVAGFLRTQPSLLVELGGLDGVLHVWDGDVARFRLC